MAISEDSQRHARSLIAVEGFTGMEKYWGHTLPEAPPERGCHITRPDGCFRIDMPRCPSRELLLRNQLGFSADYCDHRLGWIGHMMQAVGHTIDHEHNHRGQCWWEFRPLVSEPPAVAGIRPATDIRRAPLWAPRARP
jgi:hypothetical protein